MHHVHYSSNLVRDISLVDVSGACDSSCADCDSDAVDICTSCDVGSGINSVTNHCGMETTCRRVVEV